MRRNAPRGFGIGQQENCVSGTARLEGAALLQILALEEEFAACLLIERRARQDRRAVNALADALVRGTDIGEGEAVGGWLGVHARDSSGSPLPRRLAAGIRDLSSRSAPPPIAD